MKLQYSKVIIAQPCNRQRGGTTESRPSSPATQ